MFDIHGEGTKMLSCKKEKDEIDILGPLGKGFIIEGDYKTAVIVAGGIGAAPFPYLTRAISNKKNIVCFIGGRSQQQLISYGMNNIYEATDDGSKGFHGNVIELLKNKLPEVVKDTIRIFACGPNPMLKSLQEYALASNLDCQISVECSMACGFGICQGCPIDKLNDEGYFLVCKDGPVFNADMVKL
jgi:dihydroorotate dehydrogenase electron transfer subunit